MILNLNPTLGQLRSRLMGHDSPTHDTLATSSSQARNNKAKKHKCKSCTSVFKEARELVAHNQHAHQGVGHACMTCKKVYKSMTSLVFHQKQAKLKGKPCNDPVQRIFCKICCKTHTSPSLLHEKGVRHKKHAKLVASVAAEKAKALERQEELHQQNLYNLTTLTGTDLRVAVMDDDPIGSDYSDDWDGYGGDSD